MTGRLGIEVGGMEAGQLQSVGNSRKLVVPESSLRIAALWRVCLPGGT